MAKATPSHAERPQSHRSGGRIVAGLFTLLCLAVILPSYGEQDRKPSKNEVAQYLGDAYQLTSDYSSLRWLAVHVVCSGMDRATVEKLLGKGENGPVAGNRTARYHSSDSVQSNSLIFVVHYNARKKIESTEWASE